MQRKRAGFGESTQPRKRTIGMEGRTMLKLRLKRERDVSQGRGLKKRTGTAGGKAPW